MILTAVIGSSDWLSVGLSSAGLYPHCVPWLKGTLQPLPLQQQADS